MDNIDVKIQRTESLLLELLSEAISNLSDPLLSSLSITGVVCSRGKYSADVYILLDDLSEDEKKRVLARLQKADSTLRQYVLSMSGWYRCPKFFFKIDRNLQTVRVLDDIFHKIKRGRND